MGNKLLVKYEQPDGKRGTLRIPAEWVEGVEKLFWPSKVIEAEWIGDLSEEDVSRRIRVFLRGGR